VTLLEKAAGQGHAYAMLVLGDMYHEKEEYAHAVEWYTKAAEAGLSRAMFNVGALLDQGKGVAVLDYAAALNWLRRAADAGHAGAANNLSTMYTLGRGRAWQIMPATSWTFKALIS